MKERAIEKKLQKIYFIENCGGGGNNNKVVLTNFPGRSCLESLLNTKQSFTVNLPPDILLMSTRQSSGTL